MVDAVWVNWSVGNGPRAFVTATDTYSNTGKTGYDLEPFDSVYNDWYVDDWTDVQPLTCVKVKTKGCDILTAKVYKYWHQY